MLDSQPFTIWVMQITQNDEINFFRKCLKKIRRYLLCILEGNQRGKALQN